MNGETPSVPITTLAGVASLTDRKIIFLFIILYLKTYFGWHISGLKSFQKYYMSYVRKVFFCFGFFLLSFKPRLRLTIFIHLSSFKM